MTWTPELIHHGTGFSDAYTEAQRFTKETTSYAFSLGRYQTVEEFVEIAEKKLWSIFRLISQEGLENGVADLWKHYEEWGGEPVRNDELITLVVSRK